MSRLWSHVTKLGDRFIILSSGFDCFVITDDHGCGHWTLRYNGRSNKKLMKTVYKNKFTVFYWSGGFVSFAFQALNWLTPNANLRP